MKISAIVSDYDGTLCPTSSFYSNNYIPQDLYNILCDISKYIPICIISSKDFKKYTYREKYLARISIDYRHLLNWENFKFTIEPIILDTIQEFLRIDSV